HYLRTNTLSGSCRAWRWKRNSCQQANFLSVRVLCSGLAQVEGATVLRHHLWVQEAIQKIVVDGTCCADARLLKVERPAVRIFSNISNTLCEMDRALPDTPGLLVP